MNNDILNSSEYNEFSVPDTQESPATFSRTSSKDWVYVDHTRVLTSSTAMY